jgi:hypothetical protein
LIRLLKKVQMYVLKKGNLHTSSERLDLLFAS